MLQKFICFSLLLVTLTGCTALKPEAPAPKPYGPTPTANQLDWHEMEYYGLVCFGLNTYTGQEWGYGDVTPKVFNPSNLDTDQWARVAKESGMKGLILVAKHHDGFCLWPSKTTKYTVAASPWKNGKGDVLGDLSKSCKKYGLKLGVYVSPWDRNHAEYGREQYVIDYHEQWREVLTNYGDIFEVWFDGANGGTGYYGGARERRSIPKDYYQYDKVFKLVREKQPKAIFFGKFKKDGTRWVGNEAGYAGTTNWCRYTTIEKLDRKGFGIGQKDGKYWIPAEADTTILHPKKWYYNTNSKPRTLQKFVDLYYTTIGRNASFNLGLSIGPDGLIPERDVKAMLAQKHQLDREFAHNLAREAKISASDHRANDEFYGPGRSIDGNSKTYWATTDGVKKASLILDFGKEFSFNRLLLQEYIALGQRIHKFVLETEQNGKWVKAAEATTVGYKRILRFANVTASKVRISFETDAQCLTISNLGIYNAPAIMTDPVISRDRKGTVTIKAGEGLELFYSVDNSAYKRYSAPFNLPKGGEVKAYAISGSQKSGIVSSCFGLSKTKWKIVDCSMANHEKGSIKHLIDGNSKTMWHTHGKNGRVAGPHWVVIDLGESVDLKGFLCMPRHDGTAVGLVDKYSFYVSIDGKEWTLASKGEFSNITNNPIEQQVNFEKAMKARFVKFVAEHAVDDNSCVAACELGLLSK